MDPRDSIEKSLRVARRFIPKSLFRSLQPFYHYTLALAGGILYGFPSKKLVVIGVTGTKGKSSTVEIVNSILEAAGIKTAVAGTIRFKIGDESWRNMYKMTMPGRLFLQRFLKRAAKAGCTHAVIEMTSEGSRLFRYRFVYPDAVIFTNIAPEHIESHGSFEKYVDAKLNIARLVLRNGKPRHIVVANADDKQAGKFLSLGIPEGIPYAPKDGEPYEVSDRGIDFTFDGKKMHSPLPGLFNLYNILGAATLAKAFGISSDAIAEGVAKLKEIPGRAQFVKAGQDFDVIVDYAHTADSLKAIYEAFDGRRRICILGSTGGGRDKWKRKDMGAMADRYCDEIILTDEDPYDENPEKIVAGVAEGITSKKPEIVMDRREAIRRAILKARKDDVVLITGKGTDPYIMKAGGAKLPWSDTAVAKEELERSLAPEKSE